jgi:hypothetical protein
MGSPAINQTSNCVLRFAIRLSPQAASSGLVVERYCVRSTFASAPPQTATGLYGLRLEHGFLISSSISTASLRTQTWAFYQPAD